MIIITVTEEELRLIGSALGELPYRIVAQLVSKISEQVEDQKKQDSHENE